MHSTVLCLILIRIFRVLILHLKIFIICNLLVKNFTFIRLFVAKIMFVHTRMTEFEWSALNRYIIAFCTEWLIYRSKAKTSAWDKYSESKNSLYDQQVDVSVHLCFKRNNIFSWNLERFLITWFPCSTLFLILIIIFLVYLCFSHRCSSLDKTRYPLWFRWCLGC